MINRSLVGKLWLAVVVLVILAMFILGLFLSQFFEDFYLSLKYDELVKNGTKIAEMISSSPERIEWEEQLAMISKYINARIVVTDRTGLIKACTVQGRGMNPGNKLQYPDVQQILSGEIIARRGTYPGLDMTVLSVGVPIKISGEVIGAVFLNAPVESVNETVKTVQKFILYGALGTIFLATILGFILSKRLTRPILNMNRVAMEMARGNFAEKVTTESNDELGLLGSTLNFLSSELQKNIDALSTEKDQLGNILASMAEAVITVDGQENIVLMNPPARNLFKLYQREEAINIEKNIPSSDVVKVLRQTLQERTQVKTDVSIGDRVFTIETSPLKYVNKETWGVVAVLHDVTKEKRLEMLRREFVANVSHELRSPLSLLQGYVEALSDGLAQNEEERQKYLDILLDETLRLRRLVNDLLDLTQLQTGNMQVANEEISMKELLSRVTTRFNPLFIEQNKQLKLDLPENLPLAMGDEDKIQQVLVNLIDNAMKYTPEGGVVEVSAVSNGDMVDVSVSDSGPGIPADELEHVWERFYKVDKARKRESVGGTGLGLAIVKNIIQAHGGKVDVSSTLGEGSTFTFSIKAVV